MRRNLAQPFDAGLLVRWVALEASRRASTRGEARPAHETTSCVNHFESARKPRTVWHLTLISCEVQGVGIMLLAPCSPGPVTTDNRLATLLRKQSSWRGRPRRAREMRE